MRDKNETTRRLEVAIGSATLIGSTTAYLLHDAGLGVVALVLGGVVYGITIARPPK
jgi:hypothetical protein